jgi:hypothetical protein
MRPLIITVVTIITLAFDCAQLPAQGEPQTEKQKIEALIKHVENLKDATFVRNDKEYDAKTAARFLLGKWQANESSVKTAKDFIENVASVSSTSGKPYLIRFKNGKEEKSGSYLLEQLRKLHSPPSSK